MPASKYDWDNWFKLPFVVLKRGEDFNCTTIAMVAQIRAQAANRDKRVSINNIEEYVVLERVTPRNEKKVPRSRSEIIEQIKSVYGKAKV